MKADLNKFKRPDKRISFSEFYKAGLKDSTSDDEPTTRIATTLRGESSPKRPITISKIQAEDAEESVDLPPPPAGGDDQDASTDQPSPADDTDLLGDTSANPDQTGGLDAQLGGPVDLDGVKRVVKGAHLVFKKPSGDGSFEELWVYPLEADRSNSANDIKKSILAGTDIKVGETHSDDQTQSYEVWTAGNAQMLKIYGLPQ